MSEYGPDMYESNLSAWHAAFTIQLGELVESGVFDWSRAELDWSSAAYSTEQYKRVCDYFIARFEYREISIVPPLEWFGILKRKFVYELSPKYNAAYKQLADGLNLLANEDEYYKERHISSSYPETLLSENADYISSGEDREFERIKIGNSADALERLNQFKAIDEMMLDELEGCFIGLYTANINGL